MIEFPVPDATTPADALARAEKFILEFQKDPLIVPAVAPHAVYTLDAPTLKRARDLAAKYAVPLLIHLNETEAETGLSMERHKARPVAALDALGFWGPQIIAAHGVWLQPDEIQVLKNHGVGVSHNPESNMKLASGTAPVTEVIKAAGAARPRHRRSSQQQRPRHVRGDAAGRVSPQAHVEGSTGLGAGVALEMATLGGARVIGREKQLGSLEAGKLADVIVVRMDRPRQTPMLRPDLAPRLRDARRRCRDNHRQWQGADA